MQPGFLWGTQAAANERQFVILQRNSISMMRYLKWTGLAAAVLLIVSCFTPWVIIESKGITVSGIDATGTNFGKPGYFHILLSLLFIAFTIIQRVWAKRLNLLVTALNTGWALRNFFIIAACQGGECPEKQAGLYLVLFSSILLLLSSLFPDMKLQEKKTGT